MLPMAYSTGLRKKGLSKRRGDLEPEIVFPLGGDISIFVIFAGSFMDVR